MKKLVTLLLALTMVIGVGVFAFADDVVCDLSEEDQAYMLSVKSQFLGDKVIEGTISQETADALYSDLEKQVHNSSLRGLGFGVWLRASEYAEEALEIMPHKNGFGDGVQHLDGTGQQGNRSLNGSGRRAQRKND
jgi:hypothetical protein